VRGQGGAGRATVGGARVIGLRRVGRHQNRNRERRRAGQGGKGGEGAKPGVEGWTPSRQKEDHQARGGRANEPRNMVVGEAGKGGHKPGKMAT